MPWVPRGTGCATPSGLIILPGNLMPFGCRIIPILGVSATLPTKAGRGAEIAGKARKARPRATDCSAERCILGEVGGFGVRSKMCLGTKLSMLGVKMKLSV